MLRCPELKLLILDSIKTFGKSLILVIKYFWWLVIAEAWFYYHTYLLPPASKNVWASLFSKITTNLSLFIITLALFLLGLSFLAIMPFIMCLTARQTTETKNFTYYRKYLNRFLGYLKMFIASVIVVILFSHKTNLNNNILTLILLPFYSALDMSLFFFFDSNRKFIASIIRGFYLIFYFLPLCIILRIPQIIYYLLKAALNQKQFLTLSPFLNSNTAAVLSSILLIILSLISASISATLYAKIKDKYPNFFPTQTHIK